MKIKNILFNVLFSLAALVLLFGGLEVFFRTTHLFGARISWSIPHPVLGWRFTPNREYWFFEENTHPVTWRTNRFGWKDKEWHEVKKPGVVRIAALGDSYVEALQLEPEKNFLSLGESHLRSRYGLESEWMNFGRSGFTQTEEWWVLQNEILKFQPDAVLVFFFPVNDIDDIAPDTTLDPIRPYYKPGPEGELLLDTSFRETSEFRIKAWINAIKHHSAFVSLLTQRYTILKRQMRARAKIPVYETPDTQIARYLSLCTPKPDPLHAANYALNKKLLAEMAALLKSRDIVMVLVVLDIPAYIPEIEARYKALEPAFDPLFFEHDLENFARQHGIEFVGLQSLFRKNYVQTGPLHFSNRAPIKYWEYGAHSGHWNYEGHELVARALSEKLGRILSISQAPQESEIAS